MNSKIKDLVRIALVAALYVVLTVINPFSYDQVQFRISEILMFLVFFRKDYSYSLVLGCFISNFFSPMMLYDIIFGTSATILACLCMAYSKNIYVSAIFPVIFNAILVGIELSLAFDTPFLINAGWVALGETVVMIVGLIIFVILKRNKPFMNMIMADQNIANKNDDN